METSVLCGTKMRVISSFFYPKVVETNLCFKGFREVLYNTYPSSDADAVELSYFNSDEQRCLPLTCDEHMGLHFTLNASSRFGKLQIDVVQPHA
jgi:hypothetical protein